MKNVKKSIFAIIIILIGYIIYKLIPLFVFLFVMMTDKEGRLNSQELICDFINKNKEVLNEIAEKNLEGEGDIDIVINDGEVVVLNGNTHTNNDCFEGVKWLFESEYVEKIRIYNCHNIQMMIFQTSSTGIVGSGEFKGFCYLKEGEPNEVFDKKTLFPGRKVFYQEVMHQWFYYRCLE